MTKLALLFLLIINTQSADIISPADKLFNKGNSLFMRGDYASSIQIFEQLHKKGISNPNLYCNLGNAYLKAGKLGNAMLSYERGLKLTPFDDRLIHNRDLLYSQINIKPDSYNHFNGISDIILIKTASYILLTALILCLASALFFVTYLKFHRPVFNSAYRYLLFLSIPVIIFCISFLMILTNSEYGIIKKNIISKAGPASTAKNTFQLVEGEKVLILNSFNGWYKLKKYTGEMAWVPTNVLANINYQTPLKLRTNSSF